MLAASEELSMINLRELFLALFVGGTVLAVLGYGADWLLRRHEHWLVKRWAAKQVK
jgi:hypothetical protein